VLELLVIKEQMKNVGDKIFIKDMKYRSLFSRRRRRRVR
jgi:hypothetical protein